ncbi:hypothetical protein [[Haemophilus] ducreyi]|uniref:hypothetical protein n=1 Tax=Haemophilus ducreyi TaxID=730 RepID=UPI003B96FAB9
MTGLLSACTPTKTYVTNTSCAGFGIIKASRKDTTETLAQILVHNTTYRQICKDAAQKDK